MGLISIKMEKNFIMNNMNLYLRYGHEHGKKMKMNMDFHIFIFVRDGLCGLW